MYTNNGNISLPLAVWLAANDGYDHDDRTHVISATSLLKPIKSIVLSAQLVREGASGNEIDIQDLVPARLGTAIHTAVEVAWTDHLETAMRNLGHNQKAIDHIVVNPPVDNFDPDKHNVWLEIRSYKEVGDWIVSGKFDFVDNGRVKDVKSTGTFNWISGSNDDKYGWQGSIYRWLNPDIITDDVMDIEFVFTDWKPTGIHNNKDYPPKRVMTRTIPLKPVEEVDAFVNAKLRQIEELMDCTEQQMPACTPEEVWQKSATWKYFTKAGNQRAYKNFDNPDDAYAFLEGERKGVGVVVMVPGEVKYCNYCPAAVICHQAAEYKEAGLLK